MQQTIVELIDDIDGSSEAETVLFGFNGKEYEIELSEKNRAKLEKVLTPFLNKARTKGRPARRHVKTTPDSTVVRAWAQANGVEVSERGRIPKAVIEQYEAARLGRLDLTEGEDPQRG